MAESCVKNGNKYARNLTFSCSQSFKKQGVNVEMWNCGNVKMDIRPFLGTSLIENKPGNKV